MAKKKQAVTDLRKWTPDKWADEMWKLYGHHDCKRSVPLMWLCTIEYASKIAEDVRRYAMNDLLVHMVDAFTWIVSFAAKLHNDPIVSASFKFTDTFADIVAFKYPGVCGICGSPKCTCGLVREAIESISDKKAQYGTLFDKRKQFRTDNAGYRAKKLDDWTRMFEKAYGDIISGLSLEHVAFHFMEEVGEVANAIRRLNEEAAKFPSEVKKINSVESAVKKYMHKGTTGGLRTAVDLKLSLAVEIADAFSWWNALFLKIAQIFKETESPLIRAPKPSFLLQRVYKTRGRRLLCPKCGKAPCDCKIFIGQEGSTSR